MSAVFERLAALRCEMKKHGADAYIICTEDFHGSEYVGAHFKLREYFSGFDGSAGTLVVTAEKTALWTDGRYFLQAAAQLRGTEIALMKEGEPQTPSVAEYLCCELKEGMTAAFDGRAVRCTTARELEAKLSKQGVSILYTIDIAGNVWADRPPLSAQRVWQLPDEYAGASRAEKLSRIRAEMKKQSADGYAVAALDEIAWALNLRGNDVEYNPVFLSFMVITEHSVELFANADIFSNDIVSALLKDGITLRPYNDIYKALAEFSAEKTLLLDPSKVNFMFAKSVGKDVKLIERSSPISAMKALKSAAEADGERRAHIKDGVAVTRFMFWLKNNVASGEITEISAAEKLERFRREQENYLGQSFDPIIAYGSHGAIVHYSASPETNAVLLPRGLVLCDTGGHYLEGTTDITRTIALGELTPEEKKCFTLVLMGNLNLAAARFMDGTRGANLDYTAREPLWRHGMDFNHGTGHGVGYVLNVHEGPQRIHWRIKNGGAQSAEIKHGMITSDEPGVYIEGKFGIRHENLLLCKEWQTTDFGRFFCFETLTLVPFDLDAIDPSLMSDRERTLLNEYHRRVYETISPMLPENEREWLRHATREI